MSKVELYKDVNNSLGEGITWSSIDQSLFWVDIKENAKLRVEKWFQKNK